MVVVGSSRYWGPFTDRKFETRMKTRISIETGFDTRAGIVKLSESGKEKARALKVVGLF